MKKVILSISLLFIVSLFSSSLFSQGCVEATSEDGPQLVGYIQPQFDYYFFGDDPNGNAIKPSSFYFKRARVGVVGSIPYDISYYVMAEFSPAASGPQLLDAFVSYAPFGKYVKFSMGQFKSPFSLELNTPCHALYTIRRSTVVNELASPFRELGFMLLGSFGKERDIISYKVAILNGTGINNILSSTNYDDNQNKDIAARVVFAPWKFKIGASYRTGLIGTKSSNGDQKSRTRYAADLGFEGWNFRFQGEYIFGQDIGKVDGGGGCGGKATNELDKFDKGGYWAMAMYSFNFGLEPVIKYEYYNPDNGAYKFLGKTQVYPQSTLTVGLNYFLNDWTRLQLNYLYNAEVATNGDINEYKNDALMFQVQVKF